MTAPNTPPPNIESKTTDWVVAVTKGTLSIVPGIGGFAGELVGAVIPNQRLDRLVEFVKLLAQKLDAANVTVEQLKDQQSAVADLFEEAMRQAAAPSSQMRRAYLANLVAAGAQEAERNTMRTSHFMRLLAQLSDLEILTLAEQAGIDGAKASIEKAENVNSPSAMKLAFAARLVSSGLLEVEDEQNSIFRTVLDQSSDESNSWIKSMMPKSLPRYVVTEAGREFLSFLDEESLPTD